jgi:hypothetical protein
MSETIWQAECVGMSPWDAAHRFAAEHFGEPRGVARLAGAYDMRGGWLGVFAIKGGEREYLLKGRAGVWTVEGM